MTSSLRYVVITPARNEEANLARLAECLVRQSIRPELWMIADDASTDATPQIAEDYAANHDFIRHLRLDASSAGGYANRMAGGAAPRAFNRALATVDVKWDVICKLDGDLSFHDDYFEGLLGRFDADPSLGIGGGHCFEWHGDELKMEWVPDYHVRGATKAYRRECFEQIGGVEEVLGWDGIDEIRAQMTGWSTRSFADLPVIHHRPTGSRGGTLKGRVRGGRCNYYLGYSPSFMLARCIRRMADPPYVVGGLAMFWGYALSSLQRRERYHDLEFQRYLRATQRQRLGQSLAALVRHGR
ncbi:MAG TPA: glycosyltransferase family A protein [Coriobacteriia bacterium]|nr:glycosyltransferase family A protein [Coriobacteriia bacterium]